MLRSKKEVFSFRTLVQTIRNYFKTDTISGLTKALEKEKAESIKKSKPMPIVKYIDTMNRLYGNSKTDEHGNVESATDRIREQQPKEPVAKKAPKMSATRSWQIIKDSMSKDELEEHYKEHPKERPVKLAPIELDKGLTDMLGDEDWLL